MTPDAIALLTSIDASLKKLVAIAESRRPKPPMVDLDGQYGDPEVKFNPRDWTGNLYKGQRFSQCEPGYLDALAESYDYFVTKAEREIKDATDEESLQAARKNEKYSKLNAARARGWAERLRAGWTPPVQERGDGW